MGLLRGFVLFLPGETLGSSVVDSGRRGVTASRLADGRCFVAYAEGKPAAIATNAALPDAAGSGLAVRYVREFRDAFDAGRVLERLSEAPVHEPSAEGRALASEEDRGWYEEQDALRRRGREEIEKNILSLRRRLLFDEIVRADEAAVSSAPFTEEGRFWRSLSASLWAEAEGLVEDPKDLYLYQTTARLRKAAEDDREAEGQG